MSQPVESDEIEALVLRLAALADPMQVAAPAFENTDFRALASTCKRAIVSLSKQKSNDFGLWYFCRLSPTNTLLAVAPDGEKHVVKNGDMNSADGIALLNAMAQALSGYEPPIPKERPEEYKTRGVYWPPPKSCVK